MGERARQDGSIGMAAPGLGYPPRYPPCGSRTKPAPDLLKTRSADDHPEAGDAKRTDDDEINACERTHRPVNK